ncbi:MAG: hypothetical protein WCL44_12845 [bacterium]
MKTGQKKEEVQFEDGYAVGWTMCIPDCFKDSLKTKTFQVGDVFYDTPKAYAGTWAEALHHIHLSIQIQSFGVAGVGYAVFAPNEGRTAVVQVATRSLPVEEFIRCLKGTE